MNTDKNNKNFEELLTGAISRETPQFDFNKWKQKHKEEIEIFKSQIEHNSAPFETNIIRVTLRRKVGYIAAAFLIISSLIACFVLSRNNANLKSELELAKQNIDIAPIDDTVTINFYLKEHKDFVARQASLNSATQQSAQIHVNQSDIMYYELFDEQNEYMSPGFIIKSPSSPNQINSPESSVISNGHILTLSEARKNADFDLVCPTWLRPCYRLDQIRKIEGRDALQFLYTDGINSVSLFEQPLDGNYTLESKDFREYAVYLNQGQAGTTILAWRDDALSYVLIANLKISQLMDIAQLINAAK